ncbi:MAG: hypothetical protein FJ255_07310 [Phycisphaerae bacterium]|nr:hypothetical protein [Phycisphaerae bacterium]
MVRYVGFPALVVAALSGCVQEGGSAREPPKQPEAATPTHVAVYTGWPTDSDGNGFLDQFTVTVHLWDERFHAAPLQLPGSFEVRLVVPGSATAEEKAVASWVFAGERAAAAMRPAAAGPSYEFRVSLLEAGSDRYDRLEVEPRVVFRGERGEVVQGRGGTIWLGRPNR